MREKFSFRWLIILAIFLLAGYFFQKKLIFSAWKTTIHPDEAGYLCKLKYADLFFQGRFADPSWKEKWAFDAPLLTPYIYRLAFRYSKYGSYSSSFLCQKASLLEREMGWNNSQVQKLYLSPDNLPFLRSLRVIPVTLGLLSALLVGLIALVVGGWLAALLSFFILFYNPLFFKVGVWAIADPLLLFWLLLAVAVSFFLLKWVFLKYGSQYLYLAVVSGIIGGLALSTKINGFLALIYLIFPLLLGLGIRIDGRAVYRKRFLLTLFLIIGTSFLLFFLLHPQLYTNPLGGVLKMIGLRFEQADYHRGNLPDPMAPMPKRLFQFAETLFWRYDSWRILLNVEKQFFSLGFFLLGLVIFAGRVIEDYRKGSAGCELVVFSGILATFIVIFAYIPMNWDRYYLPLIPWVVIIQAYGLTQVLFWMVKKGKMVFLAEFKKKQF